MQSLNLDTDVPVSKGFWARQFQIESTVLQKKFDWAFGVIIPVLCCFFDPIVFKGGSFGIAMFPNYKPLAYTLSYVSIMAMVAFLLWGRRLGWLNALFSGLFLVGAIVSFTFGVLLFPLSLIGLLILIGALGFTPLLSGIVYARNAFRALNFAKPFLKTEVLAGTAFLGIVFGSIVPLTINCEVERSIQAILNGSESEMHLAASKLKILAPLVNFDQLALTYLQNERQGIATERMIFVAQYYKQMTGDDIENKVGLLMD